MDQYKDVTTDDLQRDAALLRKMTTDLQTSFDALNTKKPTPQVVFVDFDGFEDFFDANIKSVVGIDFESWKTECIEKMERYFRLENGSSLNITFTSTQPESGEYTTATISDTDFREFVLENDDRKMRMVDHYLSNEDTSVREGFKRFFADELEGPEVGPVDYSAAKERISNRPEFKANIPKGGSGKFLGHSGLEVGNVTADDIVWIGGAKLFGHYESAKAIVEGRSRSTTSFAILYIAEDGGRLTLHPEKMAEAFAETTVHEVSHALGLSHPNAGFSLYKTTHSQYSRRSLGKREGTILDLMHVRDGNRHRATPFFNSLQVDYLKAVLGVK